MLEKGCASERIENKSDISYLKSARPSNILIHSRGLLEGILSQLVTVGICSFQAFLLSVSLTLSYLLLGISKS